MLRRASLALLFRDLELGIYRLLLINVCTRARILVLAVLILFFGLDLSLPHRSEHTAYFVEQFLMGADLEDLLMELTAQA